MMASCVKKKQLSAPNVTHLEHVAHATLLTGIHLDGEPGIRDLLVMLSCTGGYVKVGLAVIK